MTREEAINYLKSSGVRIRMTRTEAINYLISSGMTDEQIETVINALTCEDCISRKEAEAIFKNARKSLYELSRKERVKDFQTREMMLLNAEQFIHLLPSVTPKFTDDEIQKMQDLEQAQLEKAYELGRAEIQPCDDAISKKDVMAIIEWAYDECKIDGYTDYCEMRDMVKELPSVTPQTSEDCISRTALLAKIDEERKHLLDLKMDGAEHILVHHARRIIEDMPSVTPKASKD